MKKKKTAVIIPANSYCEFYTFKDKIRQLRKLKFNLRSNWAPSLFIYVVVSSCPRGPVTGIGKLRGNDQYNR